MNAQQGTWSVFRQRGRRAERVASGFQDRQDAMRDAAQRAKDAMRAGDSRAEFAVVFE